MIVNIKCKNKEVFEKLKKIIVHRNNRHEIKTPLKAQEYLTINSNDDKYIAELHDGEKVLTNDETVEFIKINGDDYLVFNNVKVKESDKYKPKYIQTSDDKIVKFDKYIVEKAFENLIELANNSDDDRTRFNVNKYLLEILKYYE